MRTLLVSIGLVLLAGCGGGGDPTNNAQQGDGREITMASGDNWFDPDELEISRGETVTIVVSNDGVLTHNISIDEFNVRKDSPARGDGAVTFTAESSRRICLLLRRTGAPGGWHGRRLAGPVGRGLAPACPRRQLYPGAGLFAHYRRPVHQSQTTCTDRRPTCTNRRPTYTDASLSSRLAPAYLPSSPAALAWAPCGVVRSARSATVLGSLITCKHM